MSSRRPTVADLAHTLQGMGWQRPAAAGIAGNVAGESGVSLTPGAVGDAGNSIGLAQWNGPRAQALQAYARQRGKNWDDLQTQVQFLSHEIDTQYPDLRDRLNAISNPASAANVFMNTYERPEERVRNGVIRGRYAQQIYSTLQRLSPIQEAQAAQPGNALSLDDALNQLYPQEAPAQGGISLDDALDQYFGSGQAVQDNLPSPVEAPRPQGSIPIDPNAVNAPESPPMGDQRLQRDLINMGSMASAFPAVPMPGIINALRGLFTLGRLAPQSETPAQPETPKPQTHWSTTQKRDSFGRFSK